LRSRPAPASELLSISLDLTVQGPTPWAITGKGKFKILFVSVTVSIEKEFGQAAPATLPTIAVLGKLLPALARTDSAWERPACRGRHELVHLIPPGRRGRWCSTAAGLLTITQRAWSRSGPTSASSAPRRANDVTRVEVHELRIGEHAVQQPQQPIPPRRAR
jgi:hypothetical protein